MTKFQVTYAAGLFDGEGYVTIGQHKGKLGQSIMQVFCGIAMTHPTAILLMHRLFGGSLHSQKRQKPTHKPLHQWVLSSQKANAFLKRIRPFLLVKAKEVDVALEFQANINHWNHRLGCRHWFHPDRAKVFAYRRHLAYQLRQLKLEITPLRT